MKSSEVVEAIHDQLYGKCHNRMWIQLNKQIRSQVSGELEESLGDRIALHVNTHVKKPVSACVWHKINRELYTGSHYWWRHKHESVWRVCYIGEDHDGHQWLHAIDIPAMLVEDLDLDCFDWQKIEKPGSGPRTSFPQAHRG